MTSAIFDFDVSGGSEMPWRIVMLAGVHFLLDSRLVEQTKLKAPQHYLAPLSLWMIERFWVCGSQLTSLGAPVWQRGHELKAEKDVLWEQVDSRPTAKLIGAGHPTAQCLGKLSSSALVTDQWHPDQNLESIRGCSFYREGCSLGAS